MKRPRALVLVPHEPTLDPRVHYTAESLARQYSVTVLATVQESERRPLDNEAAGASYTTVRIPYARRSGLGMCHAWLGLLATALLRGDHRAGPVVRVVQFGLWGALGGVALVAFGLGLLFELALAPVMLATGQRPSLLSLLGRVLFARGREPRASAHTGERLTFGRLERLTRGLRVTLSVLRFTMSANTLLWLHTVEHGFDADLIYCHDVYALQTGVMLKRRSGARLIYDSHEYYPYQYRFWCYAPTIRLYESVLVRSVDVYLTVSPQLAVELGRVYGISRVRAIPNVEPRPRLRSTPGDATMSRLARGRLKLLYQGTFAEGRGLEEIVSAWTRVDGTKIAFFVRGLKNPWLEELERLAATAGLLGESIYVLPPVLERDLIEAAREADIGLIPYKTDSPNYRFACPNKLSQYLHAGLAILASRIPYVEQLVREGEVGVCYDAADPASFVDAVSRFSDAPQLVETFKKNAVAIAEREYHWGRFEDRFLRLVRGA